GELSGLDDLQKRYARDKVLVADVTTYKAALNYALRAGRTLRFELLDHSQSKGLSDYTYLISDSTFQISGGIAMTELRKKMIEQPDTPPHIEVEWTLAKLRREIDELTSLYDYQAR